MLILLDHRFTIISSKEQRYFGAYTINEQTMYTTCQTFYFIRPTAANLAAYERWSSSDMQSNTWLGDLVDEVVKVELVEGNTM